MPRTIVWITGATQGIGAALARSVPYPDARVINISRRRHPELETMMADLCDPASWDVVAAHLAAELAEVRRRAGNLHPQCQLRRNGRLRG